MIFFILGTHPELSIAEIEAVIGNKPIVAQSASVIVLEDVEENLGSLQERLAGTIKIGRLIGEVSGFDEQELVDLISMCVMDAAGKNKISFGMSVYDLGDQKLTKKISDHRNTLGIEIKKRARQTNRPVRYVSSKEAELSSVIVEENNLLASGGEYVLLSHSGRVLIGQTEVVQPYKAWSERDYGRPARNAKSGMLPPKLARMMINLSGISKKNARILDPFCGSGTILMEAQLMGFQHLVGSDISEHAVADTEKNMRWLTDHFELETPSLSLYVSPAEQLNQLIEKPVDLIVTETFLGSPRTRPLSPAEFDETKKQLTKIYEPSFKTLSRLLTSEGVMVIALPAFFVKDSYTSLNLQPFFKKIGLRVHQTFLYQRPGQIVGREILVLRK